MELGGMVMAWVASGMDIGVGIGIDIGWVCVCVSAISTARQGGEVVRNTNAAVVGCRFVARVAQAEIEGGRRTLTRGGYRGRQGGWHDGRVRFWGVFATADGGGESPEQLVNSGN